MWGETKKKKRNTDKKRNFNNILKTVADNLLRSSLQKSDMSPMGGTASPRARWQPKPPQPPPFMLDYMARR